LWWWYVIIAEEHSFLFLTHKLLLCLRGCNQVMPIRQLAPDVAAKIAAGEVVERPASAVKELIENSIDAGATQIRVDLSGGGLQLIRVTDNGCGISPDELPLALARHATSKVAQIDDLEHIRSLGFRGEALASIAAVAEVTLLSRPRGSEQGTQIGALNGQLSAISVAASAEGTTITVRNLFSAVPARLKFLKSRNTEVSHCHHLLEQYALAYPEIRFSVFSEGRQIFATPGDGQLASVLVEVYGLPVAEQMVPISGNEHPENPEYPVVHGYVSRPTCYKSTRQYISFFVNRRWVLSRMLTAAVEGAYHSLLLTGRHPIAVVNIQIDPSMLDVNVHPAKTEIRFLKERRVFAAILRAVRRALLEEPEIPQWQPDSEAEQPQGTNRSEAPNAFPLDSLGSGGYPFPLGRQQESMSFLDPLEGTEISDNPWITVAEEESGTKPPHLSRLWQSHIRSAATGTDPREQIQGAASAEQEAVETGQTQGEGAVGKTPTGSAGTRTGASPVPTAPSTPASKHQTPSPEPSDVAVGSAQGKIPMAPALPNSEHERQKETHNNTRIQQTEVSWMHNEPATSGNQRTTKPPRNDSWLPQEAQSPVSSEEAEGLTPQPPRRLPRLRVVGQVAQSYIVTEGEDGMYLIDQHAAHERILLERMIVSLKARTPISQLLLTPMTLTLSPGELEAIEEHQQQLEHIGFSLAIADDSTLEVRAVPSVLVKQMNKRSLHELMVTLTSEESLGHTETWEERALANVACKAAIKANYFLTTSEMREMLEQLEQTKAPFSCCHGRPTMVHFSLSALARAFERR
jgi:DNA mismatch repair protein MutL